LSGGGLRCGLRWSAVVCGSLWWTAVVCGFQTYRLWATCPLYFQTIYFSLNFRAAQLADSDFMRLPLQTCLYSAIAAAVVHLRIREPCFVHYFAPFYVRGKVSCIFVPLAPYAGDATGCSLSCFVITRPSHSLCQPTHSSRFHLVAKFIENTDL